MPGGIRPDCGTESCLNPVLNMLAANNPASATVQKACFTSGTQGTLLLNFPLVRIGRSVTTLVVEVYRVLCCVLLILISSLDSSVVFRRLGFRDSMDSHDSDGPCT